MSKKKRTKVAAAVADAAAEARSAAKDVARTAQEATDTVTDAAAAAKRAGKRATKRATKRTAKVRGMARRCPISRGVRSVLGVALVVALIVGGYYFWRGGASQKVRALVYRMPTTVDAVDAQDGRQWGYAVGTLLGKQTAALLQQAPGYEELDMDYVVRGLRDALRKDDAPLLTEEQVQKLLEDRLTMERKKADEQARANKEKSAKFLAEYAKGKDVQTLPGGVLYTVKKAGNGPLVGTRSVQVHYTGMHSDRTEFDSSRKNGNEEPVTLSAAMVVPGFAAALKKMHIGDVWEIVIPADQAYGANGVPQAGIQPNEALIFEVEAVKLAPAQK